MCAHLRLRHATTDSAAAEPTRQETHTVGSCRSTCSRACCVSSFVHVSSMACLQLTSEAEQERAKSADTIDTLRSARDEVHHSHQISIKSYRDCPPHLSSVLVAANDGVITALACHITFSDYACSAHGGG
jgi:hypothetical protein